MVWRVMPLFPASSAALRPRDWRISARLVLTLTGLLLVYSLERDIVYFKRQVDLSVTFYEFVPYFLRRKPRTHADDGPYFRLRRARRGGWMARTRRENPSRATALDHAGRHRNTKAGAGVPLRHFGAGAGERHDHRQYRGRQRCRTDSV